jgi:hypothetical protein
MPDDFKTFNPGDRVKVLDCGAFHLGTVTRVQHYQQIWTVVRDDGKLAIAWGGGEILRVRRSALKP